MSAEVAVFQALTANSGVVALVGDRVFPDLAEEGTPFPLVVYERTGTDPVLTVHGGTPVASNVKISVSAWAVDRITAEQIGDQAEIALQAGSTLVNRFGHFDDTSGIHAAVLEIEVWEL